MVLSDRTIRREIEAGNIVIDPLADDAIQPASVDLRLGHLFRVFHNSKIPFIDVKRTTPTSRSSWKSTMRRRSSSTPASLRWR